MWHVSLGVTAEVWPSATDSISATGGTTSRSLYTPVHPLDQSEVSKPLLIVSHIEAFSAEAKSYWQRERLQCGTDKPLHYAAKLGDADTLSILSSASFDGISPEARDAEGLTPSDTFRQVRPGLLKEDAQTLQKAELRFLRLMASTKRARSVASISTSAGSDVFHDAVSSWANSPTASVGSIADLLV